MRFSLSFIPPEYARLSNAQQLMLDRLGYGPLRTANTNEHRTMCVLIRKGFAEADYESRKIRVRDGWSSARYQLTKAGRTLLKRYAKMQADASKVINALREGAKERGELG